MLDQRLKKYLEENYYDNIYNSICFLLDSNKKLNEFEITSIFIFDKFNLDFKCEIKIDAYFENLDYFNANQKPTKIIIECLGRFNDDSISFYSFKSRMDDGVFYKRSNFMDNAFIPHIEEEKYEEIAQVFLEKYYPEYKSDQAINIPVLLERLNLTLEYRKLSTDKRVLGIICINDCNIVNYDSSLSEFATEKAGGGTIFVDKDAHYYFASGEYSANYTIIHECVHWFIHRKYFLFNKMCNNGKKAVVCGTSGEIKNCSPNEDLKWIERQANRIASKIILPKENVQKNYLNYFREYKADLDCEKVSYAIKSLSEYYKVSIMVVKNRLSELGNKEIAGVFEYIDDRYVESYYYKHEGKEIISFSISDNDLLIEYFKNKNLKDIISSGKFVYVDKHLCINNKLFIYEDEKGFHLTPYARDNISICCIPFEYTYKSHNNTFETKDYAFCRKNMASEKIEVNVSVCDKYNTATNMPNNYFEKIIKETNDELSSLPGSFTDTLKKLMENRDVTIEELAEDSGVDEKTIRRIRNGNTKNPDIKTLVAICIGLKLQPSLSKDLIGKTNYNLDGISERNIAYNIILCTMYNKSIDDVNDFLESNSQERLTK